MRILLITMMNLFLIATAIGQSKRLTSYTASNGITYGIGYKIELNELTDQEEEYQNIYLGSDYSLIMDNEERHRVKLNVLPKTLRIIEMIVIKPDTEEEFVYFILNSSNLSRYVLDIESAIESCEIKPCASDLILEDDEK